MKNKFKNFWDKKWGLIKVNNKLKENPFALEVLKYKTNGNLLDLWAWLWRESIYFSNKWFFVSAFDFSEIALNKFELKNWEKIVWDTLNYNFKKENYDVIFSLNSLHYFYLNDFKKIVKKLYNSLKKWWYIFLEVKSENNKDFWKWECLEKNYYKNKDDLKYFFNKDILKSCFKDFKIIKLEEKNAFHYEIWKDNKTHNFIDLIAKKPW